MNTTGDTTRESSPEAALDSDTIRDAVREHYARLIDTGTDGCCTPAAAGTTEGTRTASCCDPDYLVAAGIEGTRPTGDEVTLPRDHRTCRGCWNG